MRTGGIVKYSSSNPENFIQERNRNDLRHSKSRKAKNIIPYLKCREMQRNVTFLQVTKTRQKPTISDFAKLCKTMQKQTNYRNRYRHRIVEKTVI
jgi:hypothetical protein